MHTVNTANTEAAPRVAPEGGADEAARAARRQQLKARVERLFRYSLQRNQINPLMHQIWRYRLDQLEGDHAAVH